MMRTAFLLCLAVVAATASAASQPLLDETEATGGVRVALALEDIAGDRATLVATFTPQAGEQWHLYGSELPETGIEFMPGTAIGRPTKITVPEDGALAITGEPVASVAAEAYENPNLQVTYDIYPSGPVTLRYPVRLPAGDGTSVPAELQVWYMLCSDEACLAPSSGRAVTVQVPTAATGDPASGDGG